MLQPTAPVERDSRLLTSPVSQQTIPPTPSLSNADLPPSKPTLISSTFIQSSSTNHKSTKSDGSQPVGNPVSPDAHSSNTDSATRTVSDVTQDSLDHILAHLLNDISSPSFQRPSSISTAKTDENMNIQGRTMPLIDGNINLSPSADDANVFEDDLNGDYDVPCGTSDEALDQQNPDYNTPSSPISCNDTCPPFVVVRRKERRTTDILADSSNENIALMKNDADYDIPRATNDGDYEVSDSRSQHSVTPSRESSDSGELVEGKQRAVDCQSAGEKTNQTATGTGTDEHDTSVAQSSSTMSSSSPCSDTLPSRASIEEPWRLSEARQSVIEQFKEARLDVLTSMSTLLKAVASTEDNFEMKAAHISQLCSVLKTSIDSFISFVQLLLLRLPHKDTMMQKQIQQFLALQNGIDGYLENVTTSPSSDGAESKLAGIIHITKDIPGWLRTFAPLVECAAQQAEEKASLGDDCSVISPEIAVPVCENKHEGSNEKICNEAQQPHDKQDIPDHFVNLSVNGELTVDAQQQSEKNDVHDVVIDVDNGGLDEQLSDRSQPLELDVGDSNESLNIKPPTLPPKQKMISTVATNDAAVVSGTVNLAKEGGQSRDLGNEENNNHDAYQCQSKTTCGRLLSVSQTDVSRTAVDSRPHYEPVMRRRPVVVIAETEDCKRISQSELEMPDVRASGISQTMVDQLEELRRQADSQNVRIHTDNTQFNGFDASPSLTVNQLSENDRRLLMFYCGQMANNWNVLDNAAGAFFSCMERKQSPKVFIMHSKFVILAGHKMVYIGDVLAKNIEDENAQDHIVAYSNKLCNSLKLAIRTTKEAALKFPDIPAQQLMVDCIKEVTDWAIELKEVTDRLTYIGRPEHLLS